MSHKDVVGRLRQAIQGVGDGTLVIVASPNGIKVDQVERSMGVDPHPYKVSS